MLSKIFIKNYILINELELDFSKGLNIITGETGAGKSILINAIDIAFGAKVGKEVIKNGADKAIIELTINNQNQDLTALFEEYGIDDCTNEIILSKEITQTGSRSRVNGCLVNQEFVRIFREMFLDIHSQHQTYSFLQPKFHINLLDSYIKNPLLDEYKKGFEHYKNLLQELERLKNASDKTEEQIDFLKFQVNEIEEANLNSLTEDEDLNNELSVLENVEKLKELTGSAYWTLSGDDNSVLEALYQMKSVLSKATSYDSTLEENETELINAIESLKSVSANLRDYSSSLENDTERINLIQERLFLLDKLKRKYGGSIEKVLTSYEQLKKELDSIEFSTQNIDELEKEISNLKSKLLNLAKGVSDTRKEWASKLSNLIVEKLEHLELPKVQFQIGFEPCELSNNGIDKVEFLISTNVSEGLKPLAKVASGGEISRVMLAIKTIFAQADNIDTVIFDEIDTGISGKTSQSVAEEVKELAKYMQIIMITHQAIIASKSDKHFYVKKTQNDTTSVNIYILEGENKLKGIAELAAGEITDESLKLAQTLIKG
ncbi:MAG: DNA repair protein RecN [Cyanobacteria bacterium SIG28]|nr:DNA repair protein RecN [Cyanobacteria bacterium SIG28]